MQTDDAELAKVMQEDEYVNHYDGYKPKFVGLPEGYYRNTWGNIGVIILLYFLVHGVASGFYSLLMFLLNLNTVTVTWVFFGIFMAYIFMIIICIYVGQSKRREIESKYVNQAFKASEEQDKSAKADQQQQQQQPPKPQESAPSKPEEKKEDSKDAAPAK